ncbi:MAG: efflux RND transporter periplasmic adaptor subunit [Patescibacteria group bacterium]|nr:efflux RND transporter periplasmic adaptor subunit [Patescibacteria group bacterium]
MFRSLLQKIKKPKIFIPLIIILIFLALIVYQIAISKNKNNFQFASVEKGSLKEIVSTTGRVVSSQNVDLSFKKSGRVVYLNADVGKKVKAYSTLAKIDCADLEQNLRNAEILLATAQNNLEKLKSQYQQLLREDALNKSYEDALIILASFYQQAPTILENIRAIYFENDLSDGSKNNITYYSDYNSSFILTPAKAETLYNEIKNLLTQAIDKYQIAQRGSGEERFNAIEIGYSLLVKIADLIKTGRDPIIYLNNFLIQNNLTHNKTSTITNHLQQLTTYSQTIDSYLQNLLIIRNQINTQKDLLNNYPFDIKSQELTVKQYQNNLEDARNKVADCYLTAPFDGVITKFDLQIGQMVTANIPVASLIADNQYEIETLISEIDIAKIKVGNKAKITLDAYGPNKIFEAQVIHLDPAATLVEGVPTYKAKLQFINVNNDEIKAGMSANIDIITQEKENVLMIPRRAVISSNGTKMVRVWYKDAKTIEERKVETGITGENAMVEILNGLNEGEMIIVSGK